LPLVARVTSWFKEVVRRRKSAAPSAAPRRPVRGWNSRNSVLAEWRRVDLEPIEQAARSPERQVGELVTELIQKLGLPQRRTAAAVFKEWNRLVDPTVTAHAQPAGLRKGTLFVTVDSSVWLSEIVRYRQQEILERLQHCFGRTLVTRLSFRLG
jgi:predicted nucleic acid-binding Zn ribbon protein